MSGLLFLVPENFSSSAHPLRGNFGEDSGAPSVNRFFMQNRVHKIDSLVQAYVERAHFNGSVLVAAGGVLIYESSIGMANYFDKSKLTKQHSFQLASVSKQFTAIAILLLHQRNMLSIDDPLSKYLPELPYPGVTIRNLLNHTAGVPDYLKLIEDECTLEKLPTNDHLIKLLSDRNLPCYFTPGRRFSYSNTGYAILASVVEKVTGDSFSGFLRSQIFDPLQMNYTFTSVEKINQQTSVATITSGHRGFRNRYTLPFPTIHDRILGDKGIFSNAGDLFKWDQALYSESLISAKLLADAFSPTTLANGKTVDYGFGFRLDERSPEKLVYHHGTWQGYRTSFMRYLANGNTIIILNNTNQRLNHEIIENIEPIIMAPFEPNSTQILARVIVESGLIPSLKTFERMKAGGLIVRPDIRILEDVALGLSKERHFTQSNRVLEFLEIVDLAYTNDPLDKPI